MRNKDLQKLTNEQLLIEKKKMNQSKLWQALFIGFLAGILIFGLAAWSMSSNKNSGLLIPMLIPVVFIYKILKAPNKHRDLEEILKERNLN